MPPSASARALLDEIYDMYAEKRLGSSEDCIKCADLPFWKDNFDARIGPVPIYHVGNAYAEAKKKIVFAASVGYGWDSEFAAVKNCGTVEEWKDRLEAARNSNPAGIRAAWFQLDYAALSGSERDKLINIMHDAQQSLYEDARISIYRALKEVCSRLYGKESGFENIALLNLIHCNDGGKDRSKLPAGIPGFCCNKQEADNNYWFARTLAILKPDIVVTMCTTRDYWILRQPFIKEEPYGDAVGPFEGHPDLRGRMRFEQYIQMLLEFIEQRQRLP